MKRKLLSVLLALVLVLSFSLVTAVPVAAQTDRLVPSEYATIQAAIDAADPYDTIIVAEGTYREYLHITTDGLTIEGAGIDQSIIDLDGLIPYWHYPGNKSFASRAGVLITGYGSSDEIIEGITFSGFTVKNAGLNPPITATGTHTGLDDVAILTDSSASWETDELVGQWIHNYGDKDLVDWKPARSYGEITANTATTVTVTLSGGVENDWDAGDPYLITTYEEFHNTFWIHYPNYDGLRGISIGNGKDILIQNCKITDSGYGGITTGYARLVTTHQYSEGITIDNCIVTDHPTAGINIGNNVGQFTIINNVCERIKRLAYHDATREYSGFGIQVSGKSSSQMASGLIADNECHDNGFEGIIVTKYTDGVVVEDNIVTGHNFDEDGAGIFLYHWGHPEWCKNHIIRNNTVTGNIRGIIAYYASYCTIEGNTITTDAGNFDLGQAAIKLDNANNCEVKTNTISCDGVGIRVTNEGSYENTLTSNTITGAKFAGVRITKGARDNTFEYNTITGTTSLTIAFQLLGEETQGDGVFIDDDAGTGNVFHWNNIYDNADDGMENQTATLVDAENNWWGDATGPKQATTNPCASGDEASDNVKYSPWLDAASPGGTERDHNVENITTPAVYNSIQAAIDFANPGDTIVVAEGTYTEHLTITAKSNLTIQSTEDAEIVPTSTPWKTPIIKVDSSTDITIRGLVIDGKNEVDPDSYSWGATATGVGIVFIDSTGIIEGNEIRNFNLDSHPLDRRGRPVGTGIVLADSCPQVTIEGNVIKNYHASGIRLFYGADADIINIIDNVITGRGLQSFYSGESIRIDAASTVNIIGNELSNNIYIDEDYCEGDAAGVTICGAHGGSPVVNITENDILNNTFGIIVVEAEGAVVEAHFNNIIGNGVLGTALNRGGAATQDVRFGLGDPYVLPINTKLNATNNWWGSANGPEHAGNTFNIGSQGDVVFGNVDYVPWLNAAYLEGTSFAPVTNTTQDTEFSSFQAAIGAAINGDTINVALKDGWTLISTDKGLSVEDWGEALVLKHTPEGETKGFSEPTTDLEPLTAFYVKTEGGSISFKYTADPDPDIYFKELAAGWNLISIPSTVASTGDILSPLRYVQAGEQQGVGLATLVSQGNYNQFSPSFYKATLTDADWNALANETLNPVCGYWVYMNAAKDFGVVPD